METADAETGTLTACYNGRKNKPRDSTVRAKPIAHHCETDGSTAAPAVTLWVGRHDPGGHSPMRERWRWPVCRRGWCAVAQRNGRTVPWRHHWL